MSKTRDELIEDILSYSGCTTGDCHHDKQDECYKEVVRYSVEESWQKFDSEAVKLLERIANHNCEIWPGSLDKKCGKCSVCLARKFIEERK